VGLFAPLKNFAVSAILPDIIQVDSLSLYKWEGKGGEASLPAREGGIRNANFIEHYSLFIEAFTPFVETRCVTLHSAPQYGGFTRYSLFIAVTVIVSH